MNTYKDNKDDENFAEATRVTFDDFYRLILSDDTDEVERILTSGEEINLNTIHQQNTPLEQDGQGPTVRMPLLHLACMYKRLKIAELFLDYGADPLYRDDNEQKTPAWTLLMYWMVPDLPVNTVSCDEEDVDEIQKAFIRNRRRHLCTATSLLDMLLEHSNDPDQPSITKGRTLLHLCAQRNLVNPIEHLKKFKASMNERDQDMYTLAMLAAFHGNMESLMEMLRLGASTRKRDNAGRNIVHILAGSERITAAQMAFMFKKFPSVTEIINEQTHNGETPLHHCVVRGNGEKIHLLLSNGAKSSIRDVYGQTPLYLLLKLHSIVCVYLGFMTLLSETTQLSLKDAEGNYPIKLMEDSPRHVRRKLLKMSRNAPRLYFLCLQKMHSLLAKPQDVSTTSNMYRDSKMVSITDALKLDCPRELVMDILTYKHTMRNKWSHLMFRHL
ncbi:ankyrin repeat domain-containing protein 61-like [Saccostrea cucullata]|uniref:ankyrin repeat domain-containing protein 61-like n=1 Tax=Saccostrea cuccullata TaxID=36930 RepID=UPI002ED2CC78